MADQWFVWMVAMSWQVVTLVGVPSLVARFGSIAFPLLTGSQDLGVG